MLKKGGVMTPIQKIDVKADILRANDFMAHQLQKDWNGHHTFVVNLLGSPGSGKTTLLEATIELLLPDYRILVMEGDIETERDAQRIRSHGVDAVQITTGGTCHLEAHMIMQVWESLETHTYDFIFIENVGNLVCPASYLLGEHLRVVMLSIPEGDDKPRKYPKAFRTAHALIISKIDLLPYFDYSLEFVSNEARDLQPALSIFHISSRTGEGLDTWVSFLIDQRNACFPSTT